ncbi:ABC transporter ATP-binding protein [Rhizobium sp. BK399]|uniref:ABC transporter ATP-binding protein n=1 Tax=Rhizobium sp. BK399 TaxID=2587063 RepID=UPI0016109E80|nr:ABC transporter ATP-binding protein [Rhizobium sp. BK399]MBB3542444.1 lipopolysaccharide transport system ATP-binding protein [Rhizobium sp. BK399]
MSSDAVIDIQGLGKCFQMYAKPQDRLFQMLTLGRKAFHQEFWALKNVSLTVRKGETVGIIGRNGSGKSTLLQLVCGTLNPSRGNVNVTGRVAALLELGAGFNPEFTGRENVYMAASLYGLSRAETQARFDEIAAFADIGEHLDQPVKTYSSGMYVRLAFAVIAHVDADILVVDEALAVGDAVFTQRCMRFIRRFKETGTLLFVSHDINSVVNLCQKAVWLRNGEISEIGEAKTVAESYLQYTLQEIYGEDAKLQSINEQARETAKETDLIESEAALALDYGSRYQVHPNLNDANGWKSGAAEILDVKVARADAEDIGVFRGGERVKVAIRAVAHKPLKQPIMGFLVRDRLGQDLFGENTGVFSQLNPRSIDAGERFEAGFVFKLPMLPNGQYVLTASLADGDAHDNIQHHWLHDAMVINVSNSKIRYGLVGAEFEDVKLSIVA